ncbi:MAG: threonine-phosphate decarboxylase CobD [Candidatus Pelagadaptatus aseana]|uniref:threonine-phosphate decarboxylase CobD n=1 Tax=Candidatus Pelagadaptatus aseana TaxID=3120508 RepID=UPI0039B1CBD1
MDKDRQGRELINLSHGGNLALAAEQYGIPESDWLDLSTGIAPWCYDPLHIPQSIWQRLPSGDAQLVTAAASYYGCVPESVAPLSGSQQGISLLPQLFPGCRVAIPSLGYFEHRAAWSAAGHFVVDYDPASLQQVQSLVEAGEVDVVVVINPNNPTTDCSEPARLLALWQQLQQRGGCLVVDEAFADTAPELSMAGHCDKPGLVVLRSVGKFFGLAGLRLGFMLAASEFIARVKMTLHCWHISGPAQYLGAKVLLDQRWQARQRERIRGASQQLDDLLRRYCSSPEFAIRQSPLFGSIFCPQTSGEGLFEQLARRGIWVRRFALPQQRYCLRIGLPGDESQWQRLSRAFEEIFL